MCWPEENGRGRGEMGWKSRGWWRWRCRKSGQQSLYRFEDRLQSSIVAILRDPNNLDASITVDQLFGLKFLRIDFSNVYETRKLKETERVQFIARYLPRGSLTSIPIIRANNILRSFFPTFVSETLPPDCGKVTGNTGS